MSAEDIGETPGIKRWASRLITGSVRQVRGWSSPWDTLTASRQTATEHADRAEDPPSRPLRTPRLAHRHGRRSVPSPTRRACAPAPPPSRRQGGLPRSVAAGARHRSRSRPSGPRPASIRPSGQLVPRADRASRHLAGPRHPSAPRRHRRSIHAVQDHDPASSTSARHGPLPPGRLPRPERWPALPHALGAHLGAHHTWKDGNIYPVIEVDLSSAAHHARQQSAESRRGLVGASA